MARTGWLALAATLISGSAFAGAELVAFPDAYGESFVHYTTVDKPDRGIVRFFCVNPEALAERGGAGSMRSGSGPGCAMKRSVAFMRRARATVC